MIHGSMSGALAKIDQDLAEAKDSGRFMVAMFRIGEKGELICNRTTWQFPQERFDEAVSLLNKMLEDERRPSARPLPLARFLETAPSRPTEQLEDFGIDMQNAVPDRLRFGDDDLCDE